MPQAAIPIAAEAAVASTLTAAEIAAAQAAAAELAAAQAAAAQAAAAQAAAATNASVLSAIAPTAAPAAATTATTAAGTGVGTGVGGIVDLGTSPEVLQQLQAVKGPLELGNAAANTYTGPGSMSNFGELVNPFETLPPAAPPVVPSAPPVVPSAPPVVPSAPPAPPAAPPAPPAEQLVESAVSSPVKPQGFDTNVGFDVGGFENLSGIDMLAKEVGVMPGVQSTISAYGAGAPVSSPLTSAFPGPMAGPPAPGLTGLQTNLSSMGSNMPPAPPFANQTMVNGVQPAVSVPSPTPNPLINETNMGSVYDKFATPSPNPLTATQADVARTITQPPAAPPGMPAYYGYTGNPTDLAPEVLKDAVISPTVNNPFLMQSEAASAAEPSGLQGLYNEFKAMPLKDKALTGLMASSAYQMLNQPKPYEPKKYKPTFKPGLYTGYQPVQPTPYQPNYAHGGLADLGDYSDYARGGRMLKGPGDGMSDDIPATIANKQPARLANEEFVVPADVVSHLGNGSSEAGAKVLYKMMDRVRQARTGNKKQGKQINPEKYLA